MFSALILLRRLDLSLLLLFSHLQTPNNNLTVNLILINCTSNNYQINGRNWGRSTRLRSKEVFSSRANTLNITLDLTDLRNNYLLYKLYSSGKSLDQPRLFLIKSKCFYFCFHFYFSPTSLPFLSRLIEQQKTPSKYDHVENTAKLMPLSKATSSIPFISGRLGFVYSFTIGTKALLPTLLEPGQTLVYVNLDIGSNRPAISVSLEVFYPTPWSCVVHEQSSSIPTNKRVVSIRKNRSSIIRLTLSSLLTSYRICPGQTINITYESQIYLDIAKIILSISCRLTQYLEAKPESREADSRAPAPFSPLCYLQTSTLRGPQIHHHQRHGGSSAKPQTLYTSLVNPKPVGQLPRYLSKQIIIELVLNLTKTWERRTYSRSVAKITVRATFLSPFTLGQINCIRPQRLPVEGPLARCIDELDSQQPKKDVDDILPESKDKHRARADQAEAEHPLKDNKSELISINPKSQYRSIIAYFWSQLVNYLVLNYYSILKPSVGAQYPTDGGKSNFSAQLNNG